MNQGHANTDIGSLRLRLPQRDQVVMRCEALDELLPSDHPARAVWRVVEALGRSGGLAAFYEPIRAAAGGPGRDATDPRVLLGLWLYACTDGVGSARELDRLCGESDPYRWLCGGVGVNYHTLADFRVGHGAALDEMLTRVVAVLVEKGLVTLTRISQDGTRVRACAGASSFRRKDRLGVLLAQATAHVAALKSLIDDPARSAGLSARQRAAQQRAARERQQRVEAAVAALPALEARQAELAKKVSKADKDAGKLKQPRASTTDAAARVMKMSDGGFRPAVNVQLAVDTASRAIVGVAVSAAGVDAGQAPPMREQVEQRAGRKVQEHLMDGGYLVSDEIDAAAEAGVSLFVPPKPPRNKQRRGSEYEPRPGDSGPVKQWRARMGGDQGKEVYKERAATSETVNADLKTHRGLVQLTVRGLAKATCVALWCALAYNLMHFATHLAG